jgi:hypothetical protein
MGFEKSHIFGKVEVDIRTTVAGTIVFQTETPGNQLAQRFSMPIPITTRTVLRSRLPGTFQGHYVKTTGTPGPTGQWEVYGVRIWSRELPTGQWQWTALPVMDTPVEYIQYKIPGLDDGSSGSTSAEYSEFKIPVEETSVGYTKFDAPVEGTPESFTPFQVSVEATPAEYSAYKLPVPPVSDDWSAFSIPVETTPAGYSEFKLPVKPTPPVPQWVIVPIDE